MKTWKDFPRIPFALLPTPFYRLDHLSAKLGYNIYIKRDDMTGVSLGGNKVRKLEFLLAEAKAKGADYVLTTGGPQSNHAMLTAACANRCGMRSVLVLQKSGVADRRGNQILNEILGAEVRFLDTEDFSEVYEEMDRIGEELQSRGHAPYMIPLGGSAPLGVLGYIGCAEEMAEQATELQMTPDHIICTVGSGGTYAGLLMGAELFLPEAKVTGITVSHAPFAGLLDMAEEGRFRKEDNIVFLHTGGAGGVFALA